MELNRCNFEIPRKNRTCRMLTKPGRKFCGEHAMFESSETNILSVNRIPCPLDPKHTVDQSNLEDHLKICNSRLKIGSENPWIVENVNLYPIICYDDETSPKPVLNLKILPDETFSDIVNRIDRVYNDIKCHITMISDDDEKLIDFPVDVTNKEQLKHLRQQNAILNQLKNLEIICSNTTFVEYGAGKAKLAHQLSRCKLFNEVENVNFLLIEKSGSRYKAENKHANLENRFCRIRCGIEHVALEKLPVFSDDCCKQRFFGMCKHFCGSALDFALNSIRNASLTLKFSGAFLIPCCHHRMEWKYFTGQKFFLDFGLFRHYFEPICQMTSWATCGFEKTPNNHRSGEITAREKEEIGRKCKHILDFCRGESLKHQLAERMNVSVEYRYFIAKDVTPENLSLVITRKF